MKLEICLRIHEGPREWQWWHEDLHELRWMLPKFNWAELAGYGYMIENQLCFHSGGGRE